MTFHARLIAKLAEMQTFQENLVKPVTAQIAREQSLSRDGFFLGAQWGRHTLKFGEDKFIKEKKEHAKRMLLSDTPCTTKAETIRLCEIIERLTS